MIDARVVEGTTHRHAHEVKKKVTALINEVEVGDMVLGQIHGERDKLVKTVIGLRA